VPIALRTEFILAHAGRLNCGGRDQRIARPTPNCHKITLFLDRFEFKTEMDEEARRHMFRHASAR